MINKIVLQLLILVIIIHAILNVRVSRIRKNTPYEPNLRTREIFRRISVLRWIQWVNRMSIVFDVLIFVLVFIDLFQMLS